MVELAADEQLAPAVVCCPAMAFEEREKVFGRRHPVVSLSGSELSREDHPRPVCEWDGRNQAA
jgi:hypothetical protein